MEIIYSILKGIGIAYLIASALIMIFSLGGFELFTLIYYIASKRRKEKRDARARSLWRVLPRATVVDKGIEGENFYLICKFFFENPSNLIEDRVIETQVKVSFEQYAELMIGDVVFLRCKTIKRGAIHFQVSDSSLTKKQPMSSIMDTPMA